MTTSKSVANELGLHEGADVDLEDLIDRFIDDPNALPIVTDDADDESKLEALVAQRERVHCRKRAFALVANRDYTVFEVRQRLAWDGYRPTLVSETVEHLEELDLLNDERYTQRYCEGRLQAGFGPYVIERKLTTKGIPEESVKAALESLIEEDGFDIVERATQLIAKCDIGDPKQRQRAMRKLISRGYGYDCVQKVTSRSFD